MFSINLKIVNHFPKDSLLWWILKKKVAFTNYNDVIKDMYNNIITSIRTIGMSK